MCQSEKVDKDLRCWGINATNNLYFMIIILRVPNTPRKKNLQQQQCTKKNDNYRSTQKSLYELQEPRFSINNNNAATGLDFDLRRNIASQNS